MIDYYMVHYDIIKLLIFMYGRLIKSNISIILTP